MKPGRAGERGYTLLEALISVGLLAGLAGALGPAVYGAVRLSTAILGQSERQESLRILDESLTQIFENAVLISAADGDLFIHGDEKSLQTPSLAGEQSTARIFTLRIAHGALVGDIAPIFDEAAPAQSTELFPVGARKFSYYGRADAKALAGWRDQWKSAEPPLLVRVELADDGNGRAPVILDFRPAGRARLYCEFDPVSRRCRR